MPPAEPPTPTHEEARCTVLGLRDPADVASHPGYAALLRYIAASEQKDARIAELEREVERSATAQEEKPAWKDKPDAAGLWLHVDPRNVANGYNMEMHRGSLSSMIRGHLHCLAEEIVTEGGSWFGPVSVPRAGKKVKEP